MKITIDTESKSLTLIEKEKESRFDLYSQEAFEIISEQWVKVGWNEKYSYTFSWMGRPIIQLPEDMVRIQEVIYKIKPDLIIETGVAHGGSLIYYAGLCKILEKGHVIGVDIEIRPHNRKAIESHELYPWITLIEGDSTAPSVIEKVSENVQDNQKVLVLLDSCHSKEHVYKEILEYSKFVTKDSYLVVTDGVMKYLTDVPLGNKEWTWDNPIDAIEEFLKHNQEFVLEQPEWPFNESKLCKNITHWPEAWLKRIK